MTSETPDTKDLFLSFLRLGMTAFGGPAMTAHIRDLAVARRKWLGEAEFRDGIALCQSIPGATAMQSAAYVGLKVRGISGALATYIGFSLPAFFAMLALSALFVQFRSSGAAISLFNGLQVIVVAIAFHAVYSFGRGVKRDPVIWSFVLAAAALFWSGVSPFLVIVLSAVAGIVFLKTEAPPGPGDYFKKDRLVHQGFWTLLIFVIAAIIGILIADRELFDLASVMLQVDAFAFGGGFASIPLMLEKVVHVHGWMNYRTFMDGIALGQVTPGPIVITATFVGYIFKGVAGAVVATMAIFTPSFLVLVAVEPFFERLRNSPRFIKAVDGVFASFVGLLLFVGIRFFLDVPWDAVRAVMGVAALAALIKKIDILYIVPAGAAVSLFLL